MSMTEEQRNQLYRQMADSFISVANQHAEQQNKVMVSSAFLYGSARFSAFVTAVQAQELETYEADREEAVEYFVNEFRRMLNENLDNYRDVFKPAAEGDAVKKQPAKPQQKPFLSYEHLVKK